MKMTCQTLIAILDEYLAGTLTAGEKAGADQHLEWCISCVAYADSYRLTVTLEQTVRRDDAMAVIPEELVRKIVRRR